MSFLKTLWQNKEFRTRAWELFNAIISTLITGATLYGTQNPVFLGMRPILKLALDMFTKWVNLKYFGDLGVNKESL